VSQISMSGTSKQSLILVVGAGPTGLTMALRLAQLGVDLRIIEQSPEEHNGVRGTAILVCISPSTFPQSQLSKQ
jgi:2-polyprenyl-6-methoxyphenol hydroxylase-like FAD-dependent oxidoreductase